MLRFLIFWVLLFPVSLSYADEIRPGYLEVKQKNTNTYAVTWKIPQVKGRTLSLQAHLPETCKNNAAIRSQNTNNAVLQRWFVHCSGEIVGQRISIGGIERSNTDVLLRLTWLDGSTVTAMLSPSEPFYLIPRKNTSSGIAITYLGLGTQHILSGFDHLLFVFALLLIVNNTRRLILTITSFTVAHSITLGLATLGFIHVPPQAVEAVIALSIVFLAVELVHGRQGRRGAAAKWPWIIAFIFGLLHGFGFAGALAEVGLPEQAIPLALIFFNIGVELGQLLFIMTILVLSRLAQYVSQPQLLRKVEFAAIYLIGGLSSFWLFERISVLY